MNPSSFNWLLRVKSTANQMNVASTSPSLARCPASVRTTSPSSTPSPRNATAVVSRPTLAPTAHNATIPRKVASTIFYSRVIGPEGGQARRAAAGACGVEVPRAR